MPTIFEVNKYHSSSTDLENETVQCIPAMKKLSIRYSWSTSSAVSEIS